ncbi:BTAD domain-containing putative transcriptional regulator [Alistipes sp.]|uniref:BTAD domain-containing putative transcriptional regulator n=1 Tax=Alistipes sp. TaxID=1872444 RepID=UPI003AEFAE9A
MKTYGLLLLCLLAAGSVGGREPVASGLLFTSKTESITQRTSLELFDGRAHRFFRNFSLSFDLSIRDARRFGYIVRLVDTEGEEASLVFVNFRPDNKYYIDFNTTRTGCNIPMRIPPDMSGTGRWVTVRMDFDLEADRAVIHLDSAAYECPGVGFSDPARLKIFFGLHGINLDVPAMALKNIRIEQRGRLRFHIPLDESTGETVHDDRGRAVGSVANPVWLITEHFNWAPAASFDAPLRAGVAYNSSANEVYVAGRDSLAIFRTDTRTVVYTPIGRVPMPVDEAIYNPKSNHTWLYNLGAPDSLAPSVALLDMETLGIVGTGAPHIRNRLHHHNAFFDPECDTLFLFGGYGNFTYSNRLYRYDLPTDDWVEVKLAGGDSLAPRFFAATGRGRDDYEVLLFGGFGNRSGRQELGGRNLYDLTAIDLEHKRLRKLWEIAPDSAYVPATNLLLDREKEHFYALIYPHHHASSQLELCRFDLRTGASEIVSSPIPILSEEIATRAFLFRNAPMNELVAVLREYKDPQTANIRIYTLSSPPVSARELVDYDHPVWLSPLRLLSLAAAAIGIVCCLLLFRLRRGANVPPPDEERPAAVAHAVSLRRNAVYVLGDFLAFDARGRDVGYRFSAKLRKLFALILFHSKEGDNGLSTERLTKAMWPDKELAEAKNIRGVTINHLRKILNDLRGIELVCENGRWRFLLGEEFYCDYIRCMSLCRRIDASAAGPTPRPDADGTAGNGDSSGLSAEQADTLTDEAIRVVARGTLFPLVGEPWTEDHRREFEKTIERTLRRQIAALSETGAYERVQRLIGAAFAVDPLNEDMLEAGVAALRKLGRTDRALLLYNEFCARFRASLEVDYPRPFEGL